MEADEGRSVAGFIGAIVVLLIAIVAAFIARAFRDDDDGEVAFFGTIAVVAAIVGIGALIYQSSVVIPTRNVGIVTFAGKVQGQERNGFHIIAPWQDVEKFDTSIQTLKLDADGTRVTVRLGNQTTAGVDTSVQWHIDQDGDVQALYRSYRSFDNIENNLVRRQLQSALNDTFKDYDPLKVVNGGKATDVKSLEQLATEAKTLLQQKLGSGITVDSVVLPVVHFDADTERRLREYQQALADTRIAEQKKATAAETKAANDILAGSNAAKDPGVQYQNCLNLMKELADKGKLADLPETFNCGGTSSPVIVNGK